MLLRLKIKYYRNQKFNIDIDFAQNLQESNPRTGTQTSGAGYGTYTKRYEYDQLQDTKNCEHQQDLTKKIEM